MNNVFNLNDVIICNIEDGIVKGYHVNHKEATFTIHPNGTIVPDELNETRALKDLLRPILKKGFVLERRFTQIVNKHR